MSPAAAPRSSEVTLTLTEEERAQLLNVLEQVLRDKHVEAHRTEAFNYRKVVEREEALLQSLVDKLSRA
jgi:hypothetical protein